MPGLLFSTTSMRTDRRENVRLGVTEPIDADPKPITLVNDDGNHVLITYGSSSCPPTATRIEAIDTATVTIDLDARTAGACAADIAPTTHALPLIGHRGPSETADSSRQLHRAALEVHDCCRLTSSSPW